MHMKNTMRLPTAPKDDAGVECGPGSFARKLADLDPSALAKLMVEHGQRRKPRKRKEPAEPSAEQKALKECLGFDFSGRRDSYFDMSALFERRKLKSLFNGLTDAGDDDDEDTETEEDLVYGSGFNTSQGYGLKLVNQGPDSSDHPAMLRYHVFKNDNKLEGKVVALLQARARKADYLVDGGKPTNKPVAVSSLSSAFVNDDEACWAVLQILQGDKELSLSNRWDSTEYRLAEVRLPHAHLTAEKRLAHIKTAVEDFQRVFSLRSYEVLVLGAPKDQREWDRWSESRTVHGPFFSRALQDLQGNSIPVPRLLGADFAALHKELKAAEAKLKAAEAAWLKIKGEYKDMNAMIFKTARKVFEEAPYWAAVEWGIRGLETLAVAHLEHQITDAELRRYLRKEST